MLPNNSINANSVGPMLFFALLLGGCGPKSGHDSHAEHDHDHEHEGDPGHGEHEEHEEADFPRGPHGLRLLQGEGVQLELGIYDSGTAPTFVAYLTLGKEKRLDWSEAKLRLALRRFPARAETLDLVPDGARFRSTQSAQEPHSFHVTALLTVGDETQSFSYEQVEFRATVHPEGLTRSGIVVAEALPRSISVMVESPGEVRLNEERVLQVRPRFAGVVQSLGVTLGERVVQGQILATIQSNESLTDYQVTAAQEGTIVAREVTAGTPVDGSTTLLTIADLSRVWVDFAIYPQNFQRVHKGLPVTVTSVSHPDLRAEARISYVSPLLEQDTRASFARVVLDNPNNLWQPGLFVNARVLLEDSRVNVAVPEGALVRSKFGPAVFRAEGNTFELQPVATGRTDGAFTEIVSGLEPGASIATENAFVLLAEIGKSEAHHDH